VDGVQALKPAASNAVTLQWPIEVARARPLLIERIARVPLKTPRIQRRYYQQAASVRHRRTSRNPRNRSVAGAQRRHWLERPETPSRATSLVVDPPNGRLPALTAESDSLTLVEKLRRVDAGTLRYEFTVDDPATYTRPWTAGFDLDSRPGYEIYEYACHEGNYGLPNMLSAARAEERGGAKD
jgi:hypothetical protein